MSIVSPLFYNNPLLNIQQFTNIFKNPECKIIFNTSKHIHKHKLKDREGNIKEYPTFFDGDDIFGKIELKKTTKNFEYQGIDINILGLIELYENPKDASKFLILTKNIAKNGHLTKEITNFNFKFPNVKLLHESYKGEIFQIKYILQVNILLRLRTITYDEEFVVVSPKEETFLKKNDEPIMMHAGVKGILGLLVELDHKNYGCKGALKGYVTFSMLNINLSKVQLHLIKKETCFGAKKEPEPKCVAKFELIDGGPVRNETIPFRFFLEPYNLTPSYLDNPSSFSVKYFLNLIVIDDNENRYFKQKEICLFRLKKCKDVFKDYITQPIDYGDYFSVFKDIDNNDNNEDNEDNEEQNNEEEPDESDFYYKSNFKNFNVEKDENDEIKNYNQNSFGIIKNSISADNIQQSNFGQNINFNRFHANIVTNSNYNNLSSNIIRDVNKKENILKSDSYEKKNNKAEKKQKIKEVKKKNRVINIKEKDKYKNNDIFVNHSYSTDKYLIYNNPSKDTTSGLRKKIIKDDKKYLKKNEEINQPSNYHSITSTSSKKDNNEYNLFYPDETATNITMTSNFPTYDNYFTNPKSSQNKGGSFRENLMNTRLGTGDKLKNIFSGKK